LIIIAVGGGLQFISGFLEENKTLRNFYVCDVFRQMAVILGLFLFILGLVILMVEVVYYVEYNRVLISFSKIPILVIISFIGWFLLKNSYQQFNNIELIKFAFRNSGNIKFDIEIDKNGFFCWNKKCEIKTSIENIILRLSWNCENKSISKDIIITAQLPYDLSFNFFIKPVKYSNEEYKVSQNNYIIESGSEVVKKAFEKMIRKYKDNFAFKYENGFRLLNNISKNQVCLILDIHHFSAEKDDKNILSYIHQFVEYIISIKKLN
jgi:hypothetical protein